MKRHAVAITVCGFCCLGAAGMGTRAAESPKGRPQAAFEESTQLLVVEVPVNVVGRDGQSVRGLTVADFELLDDGVPQAVSALEVVDLSLVDNATVDGRSLESRPASETMRSSERRHFLLLFDFSYSSPAAILKARTAAKAFVLEQLHPSDLVAIATLSNEQGVRLVVTFTPDRAQLARGIDTLGARVGAESSAGLDPLRFLITDPGSVDSAVTGGSADVGGRSDREAMLLEQLNLIGLALDRSQRSFDRNRIEAYTRILGDLAKNLAAVDGRKHVLLFSEGFDSRLLLGREAGTSEEDTDAAEINSGRIWQVDNDNRYGNTELQGSLQSMVEEFRRADSLIQAVDIGGLRAKGDATGSERRSGKDALFVMANKTGGELFEDANDLNRQLGRFLERNLVTYVLRYERSDVRADGKFHRLQVRLKSPAGNRVAHRSGYYAPRPFQDVHPFEKALLASDQIASAAPRRDIDLRVLATAFRSGAPRAYVPVVIEAKGEGLISGTPDDTLTIEMYIYISDAQGRIRDFISQVFSLDAKNRGAGLSAKGLKYYGDLTLAPGAYRVRVLVRNSETGRSGVESVPLLVPDFTQLAPIVLPPFFFESPGRWLMVREKPPVDTPSVFYPFVVEGEPFVPAARAEMRSGEVARLCLVAYHLAATLPAMEAIVRREDGTLVRSSSLRVVERTVTGIAGVDKLLAEFDSTGLENGAYRLEVSWSGPSNEPFVSASSAFVVNGEPSGASR